MTSIAVNVVNALTARAKIIGGIIFMIATEGFCLVGALFRTQISHQLL
jgi:hypothetical protein